MVGWHSIRFVRQGPLHTAIASQETTSCLDRTMGLCQMTKNFRCRCILWVNLCDNGCECTLDLFDSDIVLTAVE